MWVVTLVLLGVVLGIPRENRRVYRDSLVTQLEEVEKQLALSQQKLSLLTELNELRSFHPQDVDEREHRQENIEIDTLYAEQVLAHSRQEVQTANSLILFRQLGVQSQVQKTLSLYIKDKQSCLTILAFWHEDKSVTFQDLYSNLS